MHAYLKPIEAVFTKHADAHNAASMKAYLLDQFEFFGIKTPERRAFSKTHHKKYPVKELKELEAIVWECFQLPQREYQYFGIELFSFQRKKWNKSSIELMERCLLTKSWWDSVDHIAAEWLDPYFKMFPEQTKQVTAKWNLSADMWLQRSSIIFQRKYKKATDTDLLSKYIVQHADSKGFFIRKAIGWALREYGKTDPAWVKSFVKNNRLSSLSEKEALKRIDS